MPVNVNGGPLEFSVLINTDFVGPAVQKINTEFKGLTYTSSQEAAKQAKAFEQVFKSLHITLPKIANPLDDSGLTNSLTEAQKLYGNLDLETKTFISTLVDLEMQFQSIKTAQNSLNENYKKGIIAEKDFIAERERLSTAEQTINEVSQQSSLKYLAIVKEKSETSRQELSRLKEIMVRNPGSPLFAEWQKQATELKKGIKNVNQELQLTSSANVGLSALLQGVRGLVGGFEAAAGAVSLLSGKNEEVEKATKAVIASFGVLNGIEELSNVLSKDGALNKYLLSLSFKQAAVGAAEETAALTVNTVVTEAQTVAATEATVVQKGLSAAMLANPAAALFIAITALGVAYLIFSGHAKEAKTSQELLSEANNKVTDGISKQKAELLPYLELVKEGNLTEKTRISIYNELLEKSPLLVDGINAQSISYENLSKNVNKYLEGLRTKISLESNSDALTESIKIEQSIQKKLNDKQKVLDDYNKVLTTGKDRSGNKLPSAAKSSAQSNVIDLKGDIDDLNKSLAEQQKATNEIATTGAALLKNTQAQNEQTLRTVDVIDKEIAEQKRLQDLQSATSTKFQDYQKKINDLEAERKLITGASKSEIRSLNAEENAANSILDKRKKIMEAIAGLEREANQSGLLDNATALDKVNEKYDTQLQALKNTNIEIERFNKLHPGSQKALLGSDSVNRIEAARTKETTNTILKQEAADYIESIKLKQSAFEAFQKTQDSGNEKVINKSKEIYKSELGDYKNYLDFLKAESFKLLPQFLADPANIGILQKYKDLGKLINKEAVKQQTERSQKDIENYAVLITETLTYNDKRTAIEFKFAKLKKTLEAEQTKITKGEYDNRLALLNKSKSEEEDALSNSLITQSDLYKKLGTNLITLSKDQAQTLVDEIQKELKKGTFINADGNKEIITPEFKKKIQDYIKSLKEAFELSNLLKQAKIFDAASSGLSSISAELRAINGDLADTIAALATLTSAASTVFKALDTLKSGTATITDKIGAAVAIATAAITAFNAIANGIKKSKAAMEAAQNAIDGFYGRLITGEADYQAMIMERNRSLVLSNKLTLDGIEAQRRLLEAQKQTNAESFNDVLNKLQQQSYVTGIQGTKKGIFSRNLFELFSNKNTGSKEITESLLGKNFDQLEQLFTKGQLTGKAKEFFLQLQKIKAEGADIDKILEDNKKRAQEIFTGITSDSILNSITDGFKNGLRSARDFANTFQDFMKGAVLNSLKFKYLEGPLKQLFDDFAAASESGGSLTKEEIADLQKKYNDIINKAGQQFEDLKKIAGIDFASTGSNVNTMSGAIRGITEQQGDLLAGQFGGLRLTALDQLKIAQQALQVHINIQNNTANTVNRLDALLSKFSSYENGSKSISIK